MGRVCLAPACCNTDGTLQIPVSGLPCDVMGCVDAWQAGHSHCTHNCAVKASLIQSRRQLQQETPTRAAGHLTSLAPRRPESWWVLIR